MMDCDPELLSEMKLLKFLAKLNNVELDKELAQKYLEQQNKVDNSQLTRKTTSNQNLHIHRDPILKIKNFFTHKNEKNINQEKPSFTNKIKLETLLKPKKVIFKSNYFIKDDNYYSIQTVSELPIKLSDGWAYDLFQNENQIVWNLGAYTVEAQAYLLDKSTKATIDNSFLIRSKYNRKSSSLQLESIEYLENQLQVDGNVLFDSHFMIINKANSLRELRQNENKMLLNCKKAKIQLNFLPFRQFEAYAQSCLITTNNLNEPIQMSSHNVAYGWPFENESQNDGNTSIIGTTMNTAEPIIVDRFYKKSQRRTNYNWFTVGSSGKGKSTQKSKQIIDLLAENTNVYIIDLQNEYKDIGKKFGATLIDLGAGVQTCINPLQVQIQFLEDEKISPKLIINKHMQWLEGFFKLVNPQFTIDHLIIILKCVKALYDKNGVYKVTNVDDLQHLKYPIISDLISELKNYTYIDDFEKQRKQIMVADITDQLEFLFEHNGKYQYIYNNSTNIDLDNEFIIFNTKELMSASKENGSVGTYVLLSLLQNLIYNNYVKDPNKNTVIFIDELHQYIDVDNPITLNFIYKMTKTVRKFNCGMDLTTQSPSDFLGSSHISKKAESILQNCQYSTIFGLKQKDLEAVEKMYEFSGGLNSSTIRFLSDGNIGNSLISLHLYSKLKIDTYYNNFEKSLFFKKGDFKEI
ncbi:conjugal transfer ATP-binding protein TraC [Mycoplasmopsis columbinasalis]|uniref:Conjugal transfer ATP-binding protein TraC n=2 Tax=Mycoplasmopsis columbinasalis TaxID=114880 RepID=A0A449BAQ3_9BACT|nr:conjugal transfer protein TraE [Mycoplasmopsis columbinasalis]VEU78250.1 conjugal transfer ATP-binding protein TraC [Mycoplasmopsis columbinasalis]